MQQSNKMKSYMQVGDNSNVEAIDGIIDKCLLEPVARHAWSKELI